MLEESVRNFMKNNNKKIFVVLLQLVLAVFFIAFKSWTSGSLRILYQSYFADILIPFSFYLLLTLSSDKHEYLKTWWVRALLVFGLCTLSETLQYFGIFALARVFDPVDITMYGVGVLLASFIDRKVFAKHLSFWE